jgi:hypothetical protein
MKRVTLTLLGIIAIVLLAIWAFLNPSQDRNWSPEQDVLAHARFDGDLVHLSGVRNFEWKGGTTFLPRWEERDYDLSTVATAWYILAPFSTNWRGPAHSFVSFGFDDGRYLALSVEARREKGEIYGIVTGMLRRFELIYIVGDEADLIGRRASTGRDQLYLYPIKADRAAIRKMLTGMLQRANGLYDRPEFYNTLTNNCTLNLVRHVNEVVPDLVPSTSWRIALPGYSDVVAHNLGLIDSTLPLEEARKKFLITEKARAALGKPDFSALIRQ